MYMYVWFCRVCAVGGGGGGGGGRGEEGGGMGPRRRRNFTATPWNSFCEFTQRDPPPPPHDGKRWGMEGIRIGTSDRFGGGELGLLQGGGGSNPPHQTQAPNPKPQTQAPGPDCTNYTVPTP